MQRFAWLEHIEGLDPVADHLEIHRITSTLEFPWDITQALSFALFRTFAVPSIGALLSRTAEFTERTQKRYDDTGLLLDAALEHGPTSTPGRTAIRRINQMHRAYDISNDDLRYVLCTFVVVPIRWIDALGWRRLAEAERIATATYYRELGRLMGIRDIPATWREFAEVMDAYEAAHFGFDPGARAVADSTLDLMATFPPQHRLPGSLVRCFSYALMDDPLRAALRYPRVPVALQRLARAAVRARSLFVRFRPPREVPVRARDSATVRGYPRGYDLAALGTFPHGGCPAGQPPVQTPPASA